MPWLFDHDLACYWRLSSGRPELTKDLDRPHFNFQMQTITIQMQRRKMQNEKPYQAISERNACFAKAYAQMDWSPAQTDSAPVGIKNK